MNWAFVSGRGSLSEEALCFDDWTAVFPRFRDCEKVADLESTRWHLANRFPANRGEDLVIGCAFTARQVEWPNPKDLSGVKVLKGLRRFAPPSAMCQNTPGMDCSDLRLAGRFRLRENLIDREVAVLGPNLRSGEEAITTVMDNNVARNVVVKRDALKTVDRFARRLLGNSRDR